MSDDSKWEVTSSAIGPGELRKHCYRVEVAPMITLGHDDENVVLLQDWLDKLTLDGYKLITIYNHVYFIFELA